MTSIKKSLKKSSEREVEKINTANAAAKAEYETSQHNIKRFSNCQKSKQEDSQQDLSNETFKHRQSQYKKLMLKLKKAYDKTVKENTTKKMQR